MWFPRGKVGANLGTGMDLTVRGVSPLVCAIGSEKKERGFYFLCWLTGRWWGAESSVVGRAIGCEKPNLIHNTRVHAKNFHGFDLTNKKATISPLSRHVQILGVDGRVVYCAHTHWTGTTLYNYFIFSIIPDFPALKEWGENADMYIRASSLSLITLDYVNEFVSCCCVAWHCSLLLQN